MCMVSDMTSLMKAERRQRDELNRSSSLLDLSTSRTVGYPRRSAGSRPSSVSAKLVPDSSSSVKLRFGAAESGIEHRRMSGRQPDVDAFRQLPRTSNCLLPCHVVTLLDAVKQR